MHYDVFNGDADGICALIQLRLNEPKNSTLVTGIKRDIQLLDKLTIEPGDSLTVLDISFEKNSNKVNEFLATDASIFYVDHHQAGEIPVHPNLKAIIDTDSAVCTSLLVNQYLGNKYPLWAVTAAFGDNVTKSAEKLASEISLDSVQINKLNQLGNYINYNGYGSSLDDLHFYPDQLYREMANYVSPFEFISDNRATFDKLEGGYMEDMANAEKIQPEFESEAVAVYLLPDVAWARRISGVYGNALANASPDKAHAVLSYNKSGGYLISVRAPLNNKMGADEFCSGFETGGGRKSAAGINHLPKEELVAFLEKFNQFYKQKRKVS
jgi:hypothetical protein